MLSDGRQSTRKPTETKLTAMLAYGDRLCGGTMRLKLRKYG